MASAHCVNNSEGRKIVKAYKGLKPLVIKKVNEFLKMGYFAITRNDGAFFVIASLDKGVAIHIVVKNCK